MKSCMPQRHKHIQTIISIYVLATKECRCRVPQEMSIEIAIPELMFHDWILQRGKMTSQQDHMLAPQQFGAAEVPSPHFPSPSPKDHLNRYHCSNLTNILNYFWLEITRIDLPKVMQ